MILDLSRVWLADILVQAVGYGVWWHPTGYPHVTHCPPTLIRFSGTFDVLQIYPNFSSEKRVEKSIILGSQQKLLQRNQRYCRQNSARQTPHKLDKCHEALSFESAWIACQQFAVVLNCAYTQPRTDRRLHCRVTFCGWEVACHKKQNGSWATNSQFITQNSQSTGHNRWTGRFRNVSHRIS